METIKLNETPVRTARNFRINNIKLENIEIPNSLSNFKNVTISYDKNKIKVEEKANKVDLAYGLEHTLTEQVKTEANKNITLTIDSKEKAEAKINFKFNEQNKELVDNIEIIAKENTNATVVIEYESTSKVQNFHNGIISVSAKNSANLNLVIINLTNVETNNFLAIQDTIEANAKIIYTIVDFGGKNSITNLYSNLIGKCSENRINTIYLGSKDQLFDLNYIGELRGEKSNIQIEVQGALTDNARKHFKGTIDFKKGCKKAKGNENESCMLLSDTAKSLSLPMLLCSEEDVEGNHSSSAGKVGLKELFYIMSRGFTLKEAMKLMVRARFNEILENIENEEAKEKIINEMNKKLD